MSAALAVRLPERRTDTTEEIFGVPKDDLPFVHGLLLSMQYIIDEIDFARCVLRSGVPFLWLSVRYITRLTCLYSYFSV